MFTRIMSELQLASDVANHAFHNIAAEEYNGDRSLAATMRALLLPRIEPDTEVNGSYSYLTFNASVINQHGLDQLIDAVAKKPNRTSNTLQIINVRLSDKTDADAWFAKLDDETNGFVKSFDNYKEITDIRDYVAEAMRARFYIAPSRQSTYIFIESMTTRRWHYIQAFLPRYFPWFFEGKPVTEEEKGLLFALTRRTPDEYEQKIDAIAAKFNIRDWLIKNMLGDIEKNARKGQIDEIDRQIRNARDRLQSLMRDYSAQVQNMDDLNIRRLGLLSAAEQIGESEIVEYFTHNKFLDPVSVEGMRMSFIVRTYLDSWDPDMYERIAAKTTSDLYDGYRVSNPKFRDKAIRKKFFDALFGEDPKLRIKMCAYYQLDLRGSATSYRGYAYPQNCKDYMPNPHLQYHNCLGNYSRYIADCLGRGDVVGAVEQCIASAKSINFAEAITYCKMFEAMFSSNNKVIELPDKTSVSPADALDWLLNQEKAKEESEA